MAIDYEKLGEHLPELATYWAMDENREVYWYEEEPSFPEGMDERQGWILGDGECSNISIVFTNLPADWKTSLRAVKRPWRYPLADASTPVDARVWVSDYGKKWAKAHYAGDGFTWANGLSSWTTKSKYGFVHFVLPDPDNPDQPPPADWRAP